MAARPADVITCVIKVHAVWAVEDRVLLAFCSCAAAYVSQVRLTAGVPKETFQGEARVSLTPAGAASLRKAGFGGVIVEAGAGAAARFAVRTPTSCRNLIRASLCLYLCAHSRLHCKFCHLCVLAESQMLFNPTPFYCCYKCHCRFVYAG